MILFRGQLARRHDSETERLKRIMTTRENGLGGLSGNAIGCSHRFGRGVNVERIDSVLGAIALYKMVGVGSNECSLSGLKVNPLNVIDSKVMGAASLSIGPHSDV